MGMQFDDSAPKIVRREVTIKEPLNGTNFKSNKVLVELEIIDRDEATDLSKDGDSPLLHRVVLGWGDPKRDGRGGFEDAHGNPLPVTDEMKSKLFAKPWIARGLVEGYFSAAYGAKLGN